MKIKYSISLLLLISIVIFFSCSKKEDTDEPNVKEIFLNFDEISPTNDLGNYYTEKGISFINTRVLVHNFSVSPPNLIQSTNWDFPITINFIKGTSLFEVQIDSDGFSTERQPQVRTYDISGNIIESYSFEQGPDIIRIESPNIKIYSVKLGAYFLSNPTVFQGSDSYDNLRYLY